MADEKLDLTTNIATTMEVKYCDLFASKTPEKYPAQVRFKGTVDGAPMVLYLDTPDVLRCLFAAHLIDDIPQHADQSQIRAKGVAIKLASSTLTFLRSQKPKEKKMVLSINGATADMVREKSAPAAAPMEQGNGAGEAAQAPQNGNGNGHAHPAREKRTAIYLAATQFVLDKVVPLFEEKEIPVTAENVAAMVNTIYIAETRN